MDMPRGPVIIHPLLIVESIPAAVIAEFFVYPPPQRPLAMPAIRGGFGFTSHNNGFYAFQISVAGKRFQTFLSGYKWENTGWATVG